MGVDIDHDGIGEPVREWQKPNVGRSFQVSAPQTTDEFNTDDPGLQWQWHANPQEEWFSLSENPGHLRLYAVQNLTQNGNLWFVPNLLLQKFPAPSFTVTTKITFNPDQINDKGGMVVMGREWAYIALEKTAHGLQLGLSNGAYDQGYDKTKKTAAIDVQMNTCYLRVHVNDGGDCEFSYSFEDSSFQPIGEPFTAKQGVWIGAKIGLFCITPNISESSGSADFDWFRFN